jgi:hypothetical protein
MKFSEQVVLGSTLIEFAPEVYLEDGCGCLIGMAGAALGEKDFQTGEYEKLEEHWPWMCEKRLIACPVCYVVHPCYRASISCVAYHVHQSRWTFDQALSYIRSIEPPDVPEEPDAPDAVVPVWNRYRGVEV